MPAAPSSRTSQDAGRSIRFRTSAPRETPASAAHAGTQVSPRHAGQIPRLEAPAAPSRAEPAAHHHRDKPATLVERNAHVGPTRQRLGGLGRRGPAGPASRAEDAARAAGECATGYSGQAGHEQRTGCCGRGAAEGAEEGDAAGEEGRRRCVPPLPVSCHVGASACAIGAVPRVHTQRTREDIAYSFCSHRSRRLWLGQRRRRRLGRLRLGLAHPLSARL